MESPPSKRKIDHSASEDSAKKRRVMTATNDDTAAVVAPCLPVSDQPDDTSAMLSEPSLVYERGVSQPHVPDIASDALAGSITTESSPFPFLRLSKDIRRIVYDFIQGPPVYKPFLHPKFGIFYEDVPPHTELLRTCRFLEDEAGACMRATRLRGTPTLLMKPTSNRHLLDNLLRLLHRGYLYDQKYLATQKAQGKTLLKAVLNVFTRKMPTMAFTKWFVRSGKEAHFDRLAPPSVDLPAEFDANLNQCFCRCVLLLRNEPNVCIRLLLDDMDDVARLHILLWKLLNDHLPLPPPMRYTVILVSKDEDIQVRAKAKVEGWKDHRYNVSLRNSNSKYSDIRLKRVVESLVWDLASEEERLLQFHPAPNGNGFLCY